jgi:hypothetical protein
MTMEKNGQFKSQSEKIALVLSEWDCSTLEEAKRVAKKDKELYRRLVECGVQMS